MYGVVRCVYVDTCIVLHCHNTFFFSAYVIA